MPLAFTRIPFLTPCLNQEKLVPQAAQLSLYLDKPPVGISPVLWEQAKQENPDSTKMIPVPLVGFKSISDRLRLQKEQSESHIAR